MARAKVIAIIFAVVSVILFIAVIALIFTYNYQLADLVPPDQCGRLAATYGVLPDTTAPVQTCGSGPCTFPASTLGQAISLCDSDSSRCGQFTWNGEFISYVTNATTKSDQAQNVYVRQT